MELRIERKKLSDLLPHPDNPRIHPSKGTPEWETLLASLEDDYFDPVIWNERNGMLVGGHYRRKVFQDEGVEEVDVVVVNYDEATHLARLFAANKALGSDDTKKRRELFEQLMSMEGFKVELTGFTASEFEDIRLGDRVDPNGLAGRDSADEGKVRDSTKLNAVLSTCCDPHIEVKEGERWQLGRHLLFCGSILRTRFEDDLADYRRRYEGCGGSVLFVPCPDPYMALNDNEAVYLVMLQPDPYVASHLVSNFKIEFPEEECLKL